jgi:hypothetical protein
MPPLQKSIAQRMSPLLEDIIPVIPPSLPQLWQDGYKPKFNFGSIKP